MDGMTMFIRMQGMKKVSGENVWYGNLNEHGWTCSFEPLPSTTG